MVINECGTVGEMRNDGESEIFGETPFNATLFTIYPT
jgi:hypothetical protein